MGDAPVISVVVPTYARPDRLRRLVSALEAQDLDQPFEVIVVDDGSPAETWQELIRLEASTSLSLQPLRQDANAGPAAARNRGWQTASAPLVAFTDDDCVPATGWLSALVAALADVDIVQGQTRPDPAGLWGPFSRSVEASAEDFYATCNVAYRRTALERVGGFDTSYRRACEDTDLALRCVAAGARTGYSAEALVHHEVHPSNYRSYLKEKPRWEGVALILSRHPEVRSKLHSRWFWRDSHPPALAAAAGLSLLLVGRPRRGKWALFRLGGAIGLLVPYLNFRTRVLPLPGVGPRRQWILLPAALAADIAEVAVLARASLRYRTLIL
jgi:glycosyltransferase involved in cell wall biosynthesis